MLQINSRYYITITNTRTAYCYSRVDEQRKCPDRGPDDPIAPSHNPSTGSPEKNAEKRRRNQLGDGQFHGSVSRGRPRCSVFLLLESLFRRRVSVVGCDQPGHWDVLSPASDPS